MLKYKNNWIEIDGACPARTYKIIYKVNTMKTF